MYGPSLMKVGQGVLELLIGTGLTHLTLVTLTFDPVTPVSIGFFCCPGRICVPSLRKVGQGVLEILTGNGLQTDKQTDRPTCAMQ